MPESVGKLAAGCARTEKIGKQTNAVKQARDFIILRAILREISWQASTKSLRNAALRSFSGSAATAVGIHFCEMSAGFMNLSSAGTIFNPAHSNSVS